MNQPNEFQPSLIPDVGCVLDIRRWETIYTSGKRKVTPKPEWVTVVVEQVIPPHTKDIIVCGSKLRGSKYWRLQVTNVEASKAHLVTLDTRFEFRRPSGVAAPSPLWRFL